MFSACPLTANAKEANPVISNLLITVLYLRRTYRRRYSPWITVHRSGTPVIERAQGNPFFLEELVNPLVDRGDFEGEKGVVL
jgi:hypothetical protein